jgi:16S rRNA pseudouridine516 synthase
LAKKQRLDKVLAHMGYGTRKELKKLVRDGVVTVNGEVVSDSGIHVDPERDRIEVWDEPVLYREYVYLMMNKPPGVISATFDPSEHTVIDLVADEYGHFDLFPVGRLDKDTVGLLILTNDGKLGHELTSPRRHIPKTYYALIHGEVTDRDVEAFKEGVIINGDYKTLPAELKILRSGPRSEIEITIYEGKYHQVKNMFAAVGKKVLFLKRISMGSLVLDPDLSEGEYRELTEQELEQLREYRSSPE